MSAASTDTDLEACYQEHLFFRPKVEDHVEPDAGEREVPIEEAMYPLPPFRQTPGPISVSQSYLRRLIIERWDTEIRYIIQASLQRLVAERWDVLAAHGVTRLV